MATFPTDWCGPVCAGIQAPNDAQNQANFAGWSAQEKTGLHPAPPSWPWDQWHNALNTTQPWPGAVNVNSKGVKQYLSLADGCAAIVTTLLNGNYPNIVAALRASSPASQWDAVTRAELDVWGTGSIWCDFVPQLPEMLDPKDPVVVGINNGIVSIYNQVVALDKQIGTPEQHVTSNLYTAVQAVGTPTVDVNALAAALAPLLPKNIALKIAGDATGGLT